MKTFTINGSTMQYVDQGEGPVLLMGHSYLWDHAMWAPQIEALSQKYRCIVPDLWAHGGSDAAPVQTVTLQDYAQDLLALMDHLEIDTFSIIGLSVGGMWGTDLTALAPQRVTSLVLMDTFVGFEPEVTHAKYFGMLDAITAAQAVPEPILDVVVPMFFANNAETDSPELVAHFREHLSSLTGLRAVDVATIGRKVFGRRDAFDDLETFTVPTMIMVGAEDKPRTPLESQLMHDTVKGSSYFVIPKAGHISNLEQPELVTEKLEQFLATVYD
ncbi:alpha/beta fold hydrolase [Photobacterium sanguinicancri]|uniref:Alpha/beta fold hydrolase n=2 Tax=Gammaproteobacteria TaxID=1236 RepID=A0AAW7Y2Q1_9GAMM|nr:alpha/beta fold hydrolase [Photobacterium sanguinicancri]MDO6542021.1 alpha/beta fold hydrolase [Photobacterium sanguinicancri]